MRWLSSSLGHASANLFSDMSRRPSSKSADAAARASGLGWAKALRSPGGEARTATPRPAATRVTVKRWRMEKDLAEERARDQLLMLRAEGVTAGRAYRRGWRGGGGGPPRGGGGGGGGG